jgi:hypothetical protein
MALEQSSARMLFERLIVITDHGFRYVQLEGLVMLQSQAIYYAFPVNQ